MSKQELVVNTLIAMKFMKWSFQRIIGQLLTNNDTNRGADAY